MISSVLIANRGEIARRIIRTARRLGVRTIAVYSDADDRALHVREADAAARLGPAPVRESYLKADAILAAAAATDAEAIHPGYGFLSENADFAEKVEAAGLVWIGPPPAAIRSMGLKDQAKRLMAEAGVPVTPGYLGENQDPDRLAREAAAIGWPVLIKAVAGGGGKGMRKVVRAADFDEALMSARREAASAFGDNRVLLEKYVTRPRHIEVQIFADGRGDVVHMFERDCSIQRRHQKVIEEAPAPGMDEVTRQALTAAAVRAARAVGYRGAGTVEFIADASRGLSAERIWFMEMNTRLQVEHPVTEAITGLDLVEWQFRIASGEKLPLTQDEIQRSGHAIEARLYAEDPANGFLPSTGQLATFSLPNDLRVDSSVESGDWVTPHYDPMLAKLITHAQSREEAAAQLARGCARVSAWPVRTNAWFLARCLADATFLRGEADTGFVDDNLDHLSTAPTPGKRSLAAVAVGFASDFPMASPDLFAFRLNAPPSTIVRLFGDGKVIAVKLSSGPVHFVAELEEQTFEAAASEAGVTVDGECFHMAGREEKVVFEGGAAFAFQLYRPSVALGAAAGDGAVRSPMPGRIVSVVRRAGEVVKGGETLVILEAMKMEHALKAPFDGTVDELSVAEGDQVSENAVLARLTPSA
ncbi:MAG: acetyl/propionyl/methylcrotonyl-CoA carboxylase subunit alpha [Caulobacteraceae bacterium]